LEKGGTFAPVFPRTGRDLEERTVAIKGGINNVKETKKLYSNVKEM
jgi:hypothetical protein